MHITKSKKILDLIEMKSRILVIIVGMYCYWYSVTIWNGDSASHVITEMGEINGFEGLVLWFMKIAPNMLIIIAMSIMMIKPPRCLTNLIK